MDADRRRVTKLAAALAAGIVLVLGLAALRSEVELTIMQRKEDVRRQLDAAASSLSTMLSREHAKLVDSAIDIDGGLTPAEAARRLSSSVAAAWWSDGQTLKFAEDPPVDVFADQAIDRLARSDGAIVGPIATAQGTDALLLQAPFGGAGGGWIGSMISLDDLVEAGGLTETIQSGIDIALVDAAERPVYWTSATALDDAVTTSIGMLGQPWFLSAAPRRGWSTASDVLPSATVVLIVGLAYAFWYLRLAGKPRLLSAEVDGLREALDDRDAELSELLRSRFQLETQLVSSLTVDINTGLPNRASFVEHVQNALSRCRLESGSGVLVATIQFSHFEGLSHSFGVTVAEQVIAQAADRIRHSVDAHARLARTAEKELAVCMSAPSAWNPADEAERLLRSLGDRFMVGERAVYSPAVIGIAVSADGYEHGPELLTKASLAAATAAEEGARWLEFRPETKEARIGMVQLEADLQAAVDRNELSLYFQPIVSITDGSISGFESLLRWKHPTEGWIGPDRFVPLAESMGQMPRISEWVLRQAVAHSKQWLHLRDVPVYVTVNLTPRDLNRNFCDFMYALLKENGIPADCIRVEVTETAVVRDFGAAARLIGELNDRGLRVLLDDFGTGYSSLSYLRDLPFHAVKIDRSFIEKMTTEARDFGLVRSIVGLVHYLGMECVAEGIETQEQLDLIGMVDCNYAQGYFFSRPVPAADVEALIRGDAHASGASKRATAS